MYNFFGCKHFNKLKLMSDINKSIKIKTQVIDFTEKYFVYGIFNKYSECIYIGVTKNIKNRKAEHSRTTNRKLAKIIWENNNNVDMRIIAIFYDENLAFEFEAILINRFKENIINKRNETHRIQAFKAMV